MRVNWEPQDVRGGRKVKKPDAGEVWMIGYHGGGDKVAMVSQVDGSITNFSTPKKLAESLTQGGYIPVEIAKTPYFQENT